MPAIESTVRGIYLLSFAFEVKVIHIVFVSVAFITVSPDILA